MLNAFSIKKYGALSLCTMITIVCFSVGVFYYGLWIGVALLFPGLLFGSIIGSLLLKNPFSDMLEGKGILALKIDSTGIIKPFIVSLDPPFVYGKLGKKWIRGIFDRSSVFNFAAPVKATKTAKTQGNCGRKVLSFVLDENRANEGRFGFFQYPCIIYNAQINSIITKDFLSNNEKEMFAEYQVLYLNRKTEELSSLLRDFGRHVVESTKPRSSIFGNKWLWIGVAILVGFLIIMFAPAVVGIFKQTMGTFGSTLPTAPITPR